MSRNASVWRNGNKTYSIELPFTKQIMKAELWDTIRLDADNTNDTFTIK
jgi:hypothetical protein